MITTTMRAQHQQSEGGIAHVFKLPAHAALARGLVDLVGALDRDLARFLVDIFAVRQLLFDDVDLGDVLAAGSATRRS